jgi:predicted nucleic acid-binding protein
MIFVDAGAWIALEVGTDVHHARALSTWNRVGQGGFGTPFTSDHVLSEALTALRMDAGLEAAESLARRVLDSASVRLLCTPPATYLDGWRMMRTRRDKRWSLADCISFVHMGAVGITKAFTFDRNFAQAGFEVVPSREPRER